jgi:large subunit ribosomal protein L10
MKLEEKEKAVDELVEELKRARGIYLANFIELNVEEERKLRQRMRENSLFYKVVKNTVIRFACEKAGFDSLTEYLVGPTALCFGYDDPLLPSKIIQQFSRETGKLTIKASFLEGNIFDADATKKLANIPSRDALLSKLMATISSPLTNLSMLLKGILISLLFALNGVAKKKGE